MLICVLNYKHPTLNAAHLPPGSTTRIHPGYRRAQPFCMSPGVARAHIGGPRSGPPSGAHRATHLRGPDRCGPKARTYLEVGPSGAHIQMRGPEGPAPPGTQRGCGAQPRSPDGPDMRAEGPHIRPDPERSRRSSSQIIKRASTSKTDPQNMHFLSRLYKGPGRRPGPLYGARLRRAPDRPGPPGRAQMKKRVFGCFWLCSTFQKAEF